MNITNCSVTCKTVYYNDSYLKVIFCNVMFWLINEFIYNEFIYEVAYNVQQRRNPESFQ